MHPATFDASILPTSPGHASRRMKTESELHSFYKGTAGRTKHQRDEVSARENKTWKSKNSKITAALEFFDLQYPFPSWRQLLKFRG